jgi:hypothetical protein
MNAKQGQADKPCSHSRARFASNSTNSAVNVPPQSANRPVCKNELTTSHSEVQRTKSPGRCQGHRRITARQHISQVICEPGNFGRTLFTLKIQQPICHHKNWRQTTKFIAMKRTDGQNATQSFSIFIGMNQFKDASICIIHALDKRFSRLLTRSGCNLSTEMALKRHFDEAKAHEIAQFQRSLVSRIFCSTYRGL